MTIRNCTLPEDEKSLSFLIDPSITDWTAADRVPPLPFSAFPGTGDAGWLLGQGPDPTGYAWLRQQTGKRGLLEIGFGADWDQAVHQELWSAIDRQAKAWELGRLVSYVPAGSMTAQFLKEQVFSPAGTVQELQITLDERHQPPSIPDGYFLKPYRELAHLPTLAALLHRAYHDRFSRPEFEADGVTVETVKTEFEKTAASELEAGIYVLLNDFGKGVGVVRSRGDHWIDGPGVVPEERGNALHLLLIQTVLAHLREKGVRSTWLVSFDDSPDWIKEYLAIGFTERMNKTCFQKEL